MFNIFKRFVKKDKYEAHAESLKKDIRKEYQSLNKSLKKMNRLLKITVAEDIARAVGGNK